MIKPTIAELTKDEMNRYELVIAIAKSARLVTDEYVEQRERADRMIANRETDKPLTALISKEYRDEKAVKNAISKIHRGDYVIVARTEEEMAALLAAEQAEEAAEQTEEVAEAVEAEAEEQTASEEN